MSSDRNGVSTLRLEPSYNQIFKLAWPILGGALAQNVITAYDTVLVGELGEVALGAIGLGSVFYFGLVFLGMGLVLGSQILIARKAGEDDARAIGVLFDQQLYITLAFSLFLYLIYWLIGQPLLMMAISSVAVKAQVILYLQIRIYELFVGVLFFTLRAFYTGIGNTQPLLPATVLLAVANVLLNYALIFGYWGFPKLGLSGAAWAAVIAQLLATAYLIIDMLFRGYRVRFGIFRFLRPDWQVIGQLLNLSYPVVFQNLISVFTWFYFFLLLEGLGETELAAANVLRAIYTICMLPAWALGASTETLVSNLLGQRRFDEISSTLVRVLRLSIPTAVLLALLLIAGGEVWIRFFSDKIGVQAAALPSVPVIGMAIIGMSFAAVMLFGVIGTGATRIAFVFEVIAISIYALFLYIVLVELALGSTVGWLAEVLYWAVTGTLSGLYLFGQFWRKRFELSAA